ncbi:hypothetical protein [uncultured Clostridium sp.]|uniref:hypothetical protein n=1 Tax=uncultured Clostridium sp. TaxID=59620 RepID=UPI002602CE6C|nr:hypothetical protein [uncultured Clostridium sp.]
MKRKTKNKQNFALYIVPIIIGVLMLWYFSSDTPMEKLFIFLIFITTAVPFTLSVYSLALTSLIPKSKGYNNGTSKKNTYKDVSKATNVIPMKRKTPSKTINNQNYIKLRKIIISASQNKQFNHTKILILKAEIDFILKEYLSNYSSFIFSNDLQEIYTKLKSSHLKNEDYVYLTNVVLNLIDIEEVL